MCIIATQVFRVNIDLSYCFLTFSWRSRRQIKTRLPSVEHSRSKHETWGEINQDITQNKLNATRIFEPGCVFHKMYTLLLLYNHLLIFSFNQLPRNVYSCLWHLSASNGTTREQKLYCLILIYSAQYFINL